MTWSQFINVRLHRQHRLQFVKFLVHHVKPRQPFLDQLGIAQGLRFEDRDARGIAFAANGVGQRQLVGALLELGRFGEGLDFGFLPGFLAGDQLVNVGDEVGGGLV